VNMPVLAIKYHSISDYAMFQSYYVRISGQNLRDFNFEFPHTSDNASHLRILVTGFFFQIKNKHEHHTRLCDIGHVWLVISSFSLYSLG
jgi:hypothetical protein